MSIPIPTLHTIAQEFCAERNLNYVAFTASGAFKETFEITDEEGNKLALKLLNPEKCSLARSQREVEAMQRCDSPYIAKLFEYGEYIGSNKEKYSFVLEEFLDGGTLSQKIKNDGIISTENVRQFATSLIKALEQLAALNLVHRDIKPDNIMFRKDSNDPILVDFGLVRDLSASSLTQTWLQNGPGTPYFSAPEQLNNEKHLINWRTDQFSLAVVLGICLTGQHPFHKENMSMPDVVSAISQREKCAEQFCEKVKDLDLENIIKMLEPWSVRRFQTPQQLLESFNI